MQIRVAPSLASLPAPGVLASWAQSSSSLVICSTWLNVLLWQDTTVGLMNMANPTHPGGGFRAGCRAQEEEFCRRADLFARLMASLEFYPLTGERALMTPNVTMLREGDLTGYRALPEDPPIRVLSLIHI